MIGSGTLSISDAAPFSSGTGTFDQRAALITFDCPVNFSNTDSKIILNGNIFNNSVALGTSGRAFFMKGDADGTSPLVVFSGNRTYDFSGNSNICCGKNDGDATHGGDMYIQDGATLQAKFFYCFAGSVTTVTNGTLITTTSGTSVSVDLVHGGVLNVLAGGTLDCAGKLRVGQKTEGSTPALNVLGGTATIANVELKGGSSAVPTITIDQGGSVTVTGDLALNVGKDGSGLYIGKGSITVGGTLTHGSVQKTYFTVPPDQQLGSVTAGTIAPNTAGDKVPIVITDATPANGTVVYTLMTDLSRTMTLADYEVTYNGFPASQKGTLALNDGVLTFCPVTTRVWDGGATDNAWSSAPNWNPDGVPGAEDSEVFNLPAGGSTVKDLESGVTLDTVRVDAGDWMFDLGHAALNAQTLVVTNGASLTFTNAPAVNPLPTTYESVTVGGRLDLGGAEQTITSRLSGDGVGFIRDGFELWNGKVTAVIPADPDGNSTNEYCRLSNLQMTLGPNGHLFFPAQSDCRGQLDFSGSCMKIDAGIFENCNSHGGGYVGNTEDAAIEVIDGGAFVYQNQDVYLGYSQSAAGKSGTLTGDHGLVDLGSRTLYFSHSNSGRSYCALTNSMLLCGYIQFGVSGTVGRQTAYFKDTEITITKFQANKVNSGATLTFDGATVIDRGNMDTPFPSLSSNKLKYSVAEGGLLLKVSNVNPQKPTYKAIGEFIGTGGIILEPQSDNPKPVTITSPLNNFLGTITVKSGITLNFTQADKVFGGGLDVQSGATVNLATGASFGGPVTFNGTVNFTGLDLATEHLSPVRLLTTQGDIAMTGLNEAREGTRNRFFVKHTSAGKVLCYGVNLGTIFIIRGGAGNEK